MAAADKGTAPAVPAEPALLKATVAPGRTVMIEGRRHGPGEVVELSHGDHALFLERGFIQDPRVTVKPKVIGPAALKV